eukprot:c13583_g1_i1.p2 GENE.c13583_g1_i1~~c13583_g1_i1.p2  ORF type:complete len:153 (+),score=35.06 c13583_g1_i1:716-1174(+)
MNNIFVAPCYLSFKFQFIVLEQLFSWFKKHGAYVAVSTSDDRAPTLKCMELLGVSHLIDAIVCGDDDIICKPDPDACLHICKTLNVRPCEGVLVGDTQSDMLMGRAAGMGLCIGVANGTSVAQNLLDHAHFVVASIEHLPRIFGSWEMNGQH